MKILNLYAGIGGNRKLWGDTHNILAVENNPEISKIYQDFFPDDKVVIADAHEYLLNNFMLFDFIWSSPPCQSHSQIRFNLGVKNRGTQPLYPDLRLYEEILLLTWYFKGQWVVENTRSFYEPLVKPQLIGSHYFWSNFYIPKFDLHDRDHRAGTVESLQERKQADLTNYNIINKRQILRNCVEPELGLHIFNSMLKLQQSVLG